MEKKTQNHTPGPWEAHQEATNRWKINTKNPNKKMSDISVALVITTVYETGVPGYPHTKANAHLIAACPTTYNFVPEEATKGNKKAIDLLNSIN
jgi:hypothetical protein